jgi:hypothetical protein
MPMNMQQELTILAAESHTPFFQNYVFKASILCRLIIESYDLIFNFIINRLHSYYLDCFKMFYYDVRKSKNRNLL